MVMRESQAQIEAAFPDERPNILHELVRRLCELGTGISEQVELGYHQCSGNAGHRDFTQPHDTQTSSVSPAALLQA
jgi:hypothetical protein